jgi:hypothetical protein
MLALLPLCQRGTVEPLSTYSIGQKWLYTYYEKYLNRGMDSHRLTCEVVQLVNDLPKKLAKFDKPLELHVKGFNWSMTFPEKFQNFLKT